MYPHFEEVRGGVEPWLMALVGKPMYDFLFVIIELFRQHLLLRRYRRKSVDVSDF